MMKRILTKSIGFFIACILSAGYVAAQNVTLTASSTTIDEDGTPTNSVTITATAASAVTSDQTVNLSLGGTATNGVDYTIGALSIIIPSGTTQGITTLTIATNDNFVEGTETVVVGIASTSAGLTIAAPSSVTVNILDDEGPAYNIVNVITNTFAEDGGASNAFQLQLADNPNKGGGEQVVLTLSESSSRFALSTTSVTLNNTTASAIVQVVPVANTVDEGDVTNVPVTVSINQTGTTNDAFDNLGSQTFLVTITDNDVAAVTGVAYAAVNEGATGAAAPVFNFGSTPTADVNVSLSVDNSAFTLSQNSFIKNTNGNGPNITVSVADDNVLTNQTGTLTITTASADPLYDNKTATVTLTGTNQDVATINLSATTQTLSEAAGTGNYTIQLSNQPATNVEITLTPTNVALATPTTLTFTPNTGQAAAGGTSGWNVPQTVTFNITDNPQITGDITATIVASVNDANSDDLWDNAVNATHTVTIQESETPGATISAVSAGAIAEGATSTFTVVLTGGAPSTNQVVNITSNIPGARGSVSPATLTFTPTTGQAAAGGTSGWDVAQTVTVTNTDDNIFNTNFASTITIDFAGLYNALDATRNVTLNESDANPNITVANNLATLAENAAPDGVDVTVTGAQTVTITSSNTARATVSPASLTFTGAGTQSFFVTPVDNNIQDGNATATITLTGGGASVTYDVAITDNDATPGFAVVETGTPATTAVTEGGATDQFNVNLTSSPSTGQVVVFDVATTSPDLSVSPATLTFNSGEVSKTVTVTAVNDGFIEAVETGDVTVTVNAGSTTDNDFDGIGAKTVTASVTSEDAATFTLTPVSGTAVGPVMEGMTTPLAVKLNASPATGQKVVLNVAATANGAGFTLEPVAPATSTALEFTSANWMTAQTVNIRVNEDNVDADIPTGTFQVSVDQTATDDNAFDGMAAQSITVSATDNDVVNYSITATGSATPLTAFTIAEGATQSVDITLTKTPSSAVEFDFTGLVNGLTVAPALTGNKITFAANTTTLTQTFVFSNEAETVDDDNATASLVFAPTAASITAFPALGTTGTITVTATVEDNDTAGITVSQTTATVNESANSKDDFTVVLTSMPTAPVTVSVSSNDTSESTVTPSTRTIQPADWATPVTFYVVGVDDQVADGNQTSIVTVDVAGDTKYNGVADKTIAVTTVDDVKSSVAISTNVTTLTESTPAAVATITVTTSSAVSEDKTFTIATGGTATGADYTFAGTITIAKGMTSGSTTLTVTDDTAKESVEEVRLTLNVNSSEFFVSANQGYVEITIVDNDQLAWDGNQWLPQAPTATDDVTIVDNGILNVESNLSLNDITVGNSSIVRVVNSTTLTITGDINLQPGAQIIVSSGSSLLFDGNITGGGITFQREASTVDFSHLGSPISNADYSNVPGAFSFDEANNNWVARTEGAITSGSGFTSNQPGLVQFVGLPNKGNINVGVTRTANQGDGFNLVGNPYPAAINLGMFVDDNTNTDGTVHLYNPITKSYDVKNKMDDANYGIGSMQGFFVKALNVGVVSFQTDTRMAGSNTSFFRQAADDYAKIKLVASNGATESKLIIGLGNDFTTSFDRAYDAERFSANPVLSLDAIVEGKNQAIVALPSEAVEVPLAITTLDGGSVSIEVTELSNLPVGMNAYLLDTESNELTQLQAGQTIKVGSFGAESGKYEIVISSEISSEIAEGLVSENEISIFDEANTLNLWFSDSSVEKAKVHVFTVSGQKVMSTDWNAVNAGELALPHGLQSSQLYIIKVETGNKVYSSKLLR